MISISTEDVALMLDVLGSDWEFHVGEQRISHREKPQDFGISRDRLRFWVDHEWESFSVESVEAAILVAQLLVLIDRMVLDADVDEIRSALRSLGG